ncbi:MAG: DUF2207 domain-containing protein, partial [Thermoanaerobaculia bacterium]
MRCARRRASSGCDARRSWRCATSRESTPEGGSPVRFTIMPASISRRTRQAVGGALCVTALLAAPASARELYWRELAVSARLGSDGTLSVSERHAMVFTGDWNGGERVFRLEAGQRQQLSGLYRRDGAAGAWRELEQGSLDEVDRWAWSDWETLRWRARRPSDPEFAATEIGYRIDYSLQGILQKRGGVYLLDHNFAFADREGPIERFTLDLELAPEWRFVGGGEATLHVEAGPLAPGSDYVLTRELEYAGAGAPANAVPRVLPEEIRLPLLLLALAGNVVLLAWAYRRERAIGRVGPQPPLDSVDRSWIERHLVDLPPEQVGAAWDRSVGAAEVTALLARLQQEGKISSRVEQSGKWIFRSSVLHLQLLVPRDSLSTVERPLIDGLFPNGDTTDTASLRAHYRSSGFDPAGKIRAPIERLLDRRPGLSGKRPHPPRLPSVVLIAGGLLLAALGVLLSLPGISFGVFFLPFLLIPWIVAFGTALAQRNKVTGLAGPSLSIAIGQAASLGVLALVSGRPELSWLSLLGGVIFQLGLTRTVATALQSRESAETIARRRELLQARRWLERELRSREPRLDDAWLPYLIAFGLAPQMDLWFRQFGGESRGTPSFGGLSSSGGGGIGGGGGGWTGGGGTFGGAGATAS